MSIISLLIIIALFLLAIAAFKFLVGIAKHVISIGLFIIAIAFLIYVLTGHDPFGITHATVDAAGKAINMVAK